MLQTLETNTSLSPPVIFNRLNVLVADGNRYMRALLKGVLRTLGLRSIRESIDGPSALKELNLVPIDLLITEFSLDTLDGHDLTRIVRTASDSHNPYVPIIMLTGHTEQHVVSKARDVGINEFLAKPISAEALYSRLLGVVFHPRDFVIHHSYLGPDRRRRRPIKFNGKDKRLIQTPLFHPPPLYREDEMGNIVMH